jgi:hypothetical protein
MVSDKFLGWGAIVIGCAVICPGIYEILTGTYSPVGYGNRGGWIKGLFHALFAANGPYVSALAWFTMGGCFIWYGFDFLKPDPRKARRAWKKYLAQEKRPQAKK